MRPAIEVHNSNCYIADTTPINLIKALDLETAFQVEGVEHVKSYRDGWWDGKEHLLRKVKNKPVYCFPTGLLPMLLKVGFADNFDIVDSRRPVLERREFKWYGHDPRDYQSEAAEKFIEDRGVVTGRGMLNLPIRSGKTLTAALIIKLLGLRALFVAPSDILLYQTIAAFKENLGEDAPIGRCGDGVWEPDFITVATIQTLVSRVEQYQEELQYKHDVLFVDEAHHLDAPVWRVPILASDARYKAGLSATIFANKDVPAERTAIWLQAATGPILHRVSMQRLFKDGHLVPPHILWYKIDKPKGQMGASWQRAYKQLIESSEYRNSAIADLAEEACLDRKLRVLIDTGRHAQMYRIRDMLRARGVKVEDISGKTPGWKRMEMIAAFRDKQIECLVGTVLGEGVDIPELEVVINAEGQKSKEAIIQRMRNLTPVKGVKEVLFIDFEDQTHHKLAEHSAHRLAMYQGTRGFKVSLDLVVGSDGRFHLPE
jgi:superfamily II DNA or RNA helicase